MADAARPSGEKFRQVFEESLKTWSSYLSTESENSLLPRQAINLEPLVSQTPPFLGDSVASFGDAIPFSCEEKHSTRGKTSLFVNGRSTWRTSKGTCELPPRALPKQLLLAVSSRSSVRLSEDSPFSNWPGVQGLSGYDQGNYLSILYFAWAYILSARWVELLGRSAEHECHMAYSTRGPESNSSPPDELPKIQIDIEDDACEEEALWWYAVCSDDGWNATTKYNGHVYLSPWSVSPQGMEFTLLPKATGGTVSKPPSSATALKYLTRFCVHHRLYAQCSVALAGALYIPFLGGRQISLPFPKGVSRPGTPEEPSDTSVSIPDLLKKHSKLLPKYMTLSSNTWGLRSLLHCTFFNPDIECNLVSAWLNPAFAILDSIPPKQSALATFLANRQPRLGILWLGAILIGLAKSILRDIRAGMTALDLTASAWTGTTQTFLTSKLGTSDGEPIRRDDECRLLFISACEAHNRPPIWPWKPFGATPLRDTELPVRQHAQCAGHCLVYESWEWILTNGASIQISKEENSHCPEQTPFPPAPNQTSATIRDYTYDFCSESLSEGATRGIFGWLRATGYPRSERGIYQHSWVDLEGTDEEEKRDGAESEPDTEGQLGPQEMKVERWLDSIE